MAEQGKIICYFCLRHECGYCSDIVRVLENKPLFCACEAEGHSGEPRDQQILDPESGTVYAPLLKVTKDGEVKYRE